MLETLQPTIGLNILPRSVVAADGAEFGYAHKGDQSRLVVLAPAGSNVLKDFEGTSSALNGKTLLVGPTNARNLAALRKVLPWLKPQTLGLKTSAGMGDRLGLATPGHVRALRAVGGAAKMMPIFPQQSIREMVRTGRTPQNVMDDATWGVFSEGWRDGFGADADHLKVPADIDSCVAAGFTFYTVDPGEHVDNRTLTGDALKAAFEALPWQQLEDTADGLRKRFLTTPFDLESTTLPFDDQTLMEAAVKYGKVVAHVVMMYRHLMQVTGGKNVELEVSVDETELPTSHTEHIYIVSEFKRLGVQWVSLAPRYMGRFEKGVDYIGDLAAFEADFAIHAAIARKFGPYKLSLHSGSDKFSIYPIATRQTSGLVHLKTAGTSYLEALRTIAVLDPAFFRSIYVFALERYETDRASYHVSAQLDRATAPGDLSDAQLPSLFDQFDAREILHVTFGSVLTAKTDQGGKRFYDQFMQILRSNPDAYAANVEAHFRRHLMPFAQKG